MKTGIKELEVVALLHDAPEHGLVMGQVGTVVEILDKGVYEVEFSDDSGKSYAMVAFKEEELIVLHHSPIAA